MSYDTRLDGALALDPLPDAEALQEIRADLAARAPSRGGRLVLTPLGGGLVSEDAFDWEAALEEIQRARAAILRPRGVDVSGTLRALGEDDAHLATVSVRGGEIRIERHEGDDEMPVEDWLAMLHDEDEDVRTEAATALAESDDPGIVEALAETARSDEVDAVRCRALESLGAFGEAAAPALPVLLACLQDASPFVRYWATFALGRLGRSASPALPGLERLTSDSADGPRFGALDAIRRIREAG